MTPFQARPLRRPAARAFALCLGLAVAAGLRAGTSPDPGPATPHGPTTAASRLPDFKSAHLLVTLERTWPGFRRFSFDAAGTGDLADNLILALNTPAGTCTLEARGPGRYRYVVTLPDGTAAVAWEISLSERGLTLTSEFTPGSDFPAFHLLLDPAVCAPSLAPVTSGPVEVQPPALLGLGGHGALRITTSNPDLVLECDARHLTPNAFFQVDFPAATEKQPIVEYTLDAVPRH